MANEYTPEGVLRMALSTERVHTEWVPFLLRALSESDLRVVTAYGGRILTVTLNGERVDVFEVSANGRFLFSPFFDPPPAQHEKK